MPFDVDSFIQDITKDVQVDDSTRQALLNVAKNPTVAKRLEESTLRQSDYSRLADEAKTKVRAAQEYYDGLTKWKKDEETRLTQERQQIKKRLVDEGIDLTDDNSAPKYISQEEAQKLSTQYVNYTNALLTLGMKHMKDFNEVLDVEKVMEIVGKDNVNINIAYDRFVQPKREEIVRKDHESALAQARKEGAEEYAKNHQMPIAEVPFQTAEPHPLDSINSKDKSEYGAMAAIKAFTAAQRTGNKPTF